MDACEEFFLLAVEEHILSAAMTMFHMTTTDDTPKYKQLFPIGSEKLPLPKRREIILEAAPAAFGPQAAGGHQRFTSTVSGD